MTQVERLDYLIHYLLNEEQQYQDIQISKDTANKQKLLRSLMNVRLPLVIDEEFLRVQDEYLKERIKEKGITKKRESQPSRAQLCRHSIPTFVFGRAISQRLQLMPL